MQASGLRDALEQPVERLHAVHPGSGFPRGMPHGVCQSLQVVVLEDECHDRPGNDAVVGLGLGARGDGVGAAVRKVGVRGEDGGRGENPLLYARRQPLQPGGGVGQQGTGTGRTSAA